MDSPGINPIDAYVGKRLREKRKKTGLTLSGLAEVLGVSMQQVQKYETGSTRLSASVLYMLSEVLGASPAYFFEGFEDHSTVPVLTNDKTISVSRRKPLNILIVEDSPSDELLLRRALEESGHPLKWFCVHSAKQALAFLRGEMTTASFPRPDIILVDLHMPDVSGAELLKTLKKDRTYCDIPVIVVTNSINAKEMVDVYKSHAAGYVCKNFEYTPFAENIKYLVGYWSQVVALPNTSVGVGNTASDTPVSDTSVAETAA